MSLFNQSKNQVRFPILLTCFLVLGFSACETLRKAGLGKKEELSSASALIKAIEGQSLQANWFSSKSKISYKGGGMSVSGTANIRLEKDKALWVSIKKLGFEVGRAMITTDSFFIIDRINREYAVRGLDYLQDNYNLPADFGMVQSILLGHPFFLDPGRVDLEKDTGNYQLTEETPIGKLNYTITQEDLKVRSMDFVSADLKQGIKLALEEYEAIDNKQDFSYFRRLDMNDASVGEMNVTIKFSQIELDTPKDMQFKIPARYTRMDD